MTDLAGKARSLPGRDHLGAAPLEQPDPELGFKPTDLVAHGALGHGQLVGGAAVAAMPDSGLDGAQGDERGKTGHDSHARMLARPGAGGPVGRCSRPGGPLPFREGPVWEGIRQP